MEGAVTVGGLGLWFGFFVEGMRSSLEAFPFGKPRTSPGPPLAGLVIGAVVGAAMGGAIPTDVWVPVTLDDSLVGLHDMQSPIDDVRAAITVRF